MKKIINFPPLEDWQRQPFNDITQKGLNSGNTYVIKAIRQCGKSILSELILIYYALSFKDTTSIIIEPTNGQNRKIFKDIVKMMDGSGSIKNANAGVLEIEFINGSTIVCKSAEQRDNLRGFTVSGILIYDEASTIPDEIIDITLPYVNAHNSPVLFTSTPKFKRGRFFEAFSESNNFTYDWAKFDTSKYLSKTTLDKYRKTVAHTIFIQDYLGQFAELSGAVFGDFSKCVGKLINSESPIEVMGIDWGSGTGNDFTAITILNKDKQMVDIQYFNDKDATETINAIKNIYDKWKPRLVIAEKNSIGNVYLDLLKRKLNRQVIAFNTTNESKNSIINNLQLAFQNEEISILDDMELLTQLSAYEQQLTSTGKSTFNGQNGFHDDLVMALAIAYSVFTKHQIDIR